MPVETMDVVRWHKVIEKLPLIHQMYTIRLKQALLEFQYTQGQFRIPLTLIANAGIYWLQDCCSWTKTCKLIYWYPGWASGVI